MLFMLLRTLLFTFAILLSGELFAQGVSEREEEDKKIQGFGVKVELSNTTTGEWDGRSLKQKSLYLLSGTYEKKKHKLGVGAVFGYPHIGMANANEGIQWGTGERFTFQGLEMEYGIRIKELVKNLFLRGGFRFFYLKDAFKAKKGEKDPIERTYPWDMKAERHSFLFAPYADLEFKPFPWLVLNGGLQMVRMGYIKENSTISGEETQKGRFGARNENIISSTYPHLGLSYQFLSAHDPAPRAVPLDASPFEHSHAQFLCDRFQGDAASGRGEYGPS